ncbi:glycoside hydrolase family 3 protein [Exidia glandulosa HHB12029]|uniref:beta-glucosidase n=1 Tax=Exidia glandulosa HHB12029 TaxID=1314781 RepID=A0A165JRS0_EXIGL|nr:glycoside hydrolase family 3 protein [Exidia glandulosa HHB12029]
MSYQPLALDEDGHRPTRGRRHFCALLSRSVIGGVGLLCAVWALSYFVPTSWSRGAGAPALEDNRVFVKKPEAEDWKRAIARAKSFLKGWSVEEKVSLATGVGWSNGPCVGNIPAQPSHNFPGLCLQDSPLGVRNTDRVSAFPAGINAAASFDRALIRARGVAMGEEFRGKGVHVQLGPMMNLGRVAQGGRNWEGSGPDPYLSGEASYETILGIQSTGVQACAKHLLNNEQEWARTTSSSNVDDRTEHELYGHPFLRSVQAGVASVMCSYNQINGTYACEHPELLHGLLKREYGFQGYVMSDWQATMSTHSAKDGLDMSMPGDIVFGSGNSYFGTNLTRFVKDGKMGGDRLDDMATRILAAWFLLGQDKNFPEVNFDGFRPHSEKNQHVNVQGEHSKLIRTLAAKSTILLKNTHSSLPLSTKPPRNIVLVGQGAGPAKLGPNGYKDRGGLDGVLGMGWGSGTAEYPYLVSPLEAIQARAKEDGTSVSWFLDEFDTKSAAAASEGYDAALVFVASDSGEQHVVVDGQEGDRRNLTAWLNGDALVKAVASSNANTIVIVNTVGPILLEAWIEHPNVTAVLWAGLPGQEAGNALVDVLYGAVNPSARLPYTIAKRTEDYGTSLTLGETSPKKIIQIPYDEGLYIDYRHFDAQKIQPRFEFGFGLSYTTFEYSALVVKVLGDDSGANAKVWRKGMVKDGLAVGASAAAWLHEPRVSVTFQVKNTGSVSGTEIAQLYLSPPPSAHTPPNLLKGFATVDSLSPGEARTVTLNLSRYDLSVWDVKKQGWILPQPAFGVHVGASSRDFRLDGTFSL